MGERKTLGQIAQEGFWKVFIDHGEQHNWVDLPEVTKEDWERAAEAVKEAVLLRFPERAKS